MAQTQIKKDLTQGRVTGTLIRFSAPLFLAGIFQLLYNLADMVIIGQWSGRNGLSAVSAGGEIIHALSFVAIGLSNAGQVIISQFTGADLQERVRQTIGTMMSVFIIASIFLSIFTIVFRNEIMQWMNVPAEIWEDTLLYITISTCGILFVYGYNCVAAILRGMGDSGHPFLFVAISTVLNVLLDLLFVIVLDWEVFGVALATVISQMVCCVYAYLFLYLHRIEFDFDFKPERFRIQKFPLKALLKLGIPMVLQSAAITFSMLFVNAHINEYGVLATAVTGIGGKITQVVNIVNLSFSTAGSAMIGQCIGAEKYKRVPKVLAVIFLLNGAVAFLMGVFTACYPQYAFGMFTSDSDVLKMALTYIPVALVLYAGSALRPPMTALINGTGNFKLNLSVALLDGVFMRIGLSFFLGIICSFGLYGFWYGNALASLTPFPIGGIYLLSGRWRTRKYIIGKELKKGEPID